MHQVLKHSDVTRMKKKEWKFQKKQKETKEKSVTTLHAQDATIGHTTRYLGTGNITPLRSEIEREDSEVGGLQELLWSHERIFCSYRDSKMACCLGSNAFFGPLWVFILLSVVPREEGIGENHNCENRRGWVLIPSLSQTKMKNQYGGRSSFVHISI